MGGYLEKDVEQPVVDFAVKELGLIVLKLNMLGRRGWPDRAFLGRRGKIMLIEFKRQGEEPRKLQQKIHRILGEYGFYVRVVDDVEEGKKVLSRYFEV